MIRLAAFVLSVSVLAACAGPQPPEQPPAMTVPPPVATEGLIELYTEAEMPLGLTELRAFMEANPIIDYMEPIGDLAPPVGTQLIEGVWPEPGAVRSVELADGHYVIERIITNEPELFQYQIWVFTNAAGQGIEQIVGTQRFVVIDENTTRFEWTYALKPRNALTRLFVNRQTEDLQAFIESGAVGMAAAVEASVEVGE